MRTYASSRMSYWILTPARSLSLSLSLSLSAWLGSITSLKEDSESCLNKYDPLSLSLLLSVPAETKFPNRRDGC